MGQPLDLIKTRIQTHDIYKGPIDCASKVVRNEGFLGLFRGMTSPLVGLTILNAISFGAYGQFKNLFAGFSPPKSDAGESGSLQTWQYFGAGAATGFTNAIFSSPFEYIKVGGCF